LPILRPKPGNPPPPWFWGTTKKLTAGFEAKPGETVTTSFEAKLEKTVAPSFEGQLEKTVTAGFEAKPLTNRRHRFWGANRWETIRVVFGQTTHKPSILVLRLKQETRARHLHVHGADRTRRHPTSWSPDHRVLNQCDHPWSSTPGVLLPPWSSSQHAMPHLPPAHHETSKPDSLNETKVKEKQNETIPDSNSNLTKSMTHHNKPRNLQLGFSTWVIDVIPFSPPPLYHFKNPYQNHWEKFLTSFWTIL
jgi:hypothetical protein